MIVKKEEIKLGLCKGRHDIPQAEDGFVFESISDPTDTKALEKRAFMSLWNVCYRSNKGLMIDPEWDGCDMTPLIFNGMLHLNLYVTGLTVALIAVLNVCRREGITVTLWHYNSADGSYYPQQVD